MRVLVTGGSGQLAHAIQRFWTGHKLILPEESRMDLANREAIREVITSVKPDVVINAGAFTQVDRCETEPELAMLVNGTAVGWLAEACNHVNACLVQISTYYVFDGQSKRPYREDDPVNPLSVYGKSKLLGEHEARKTLKHLVVRTAWLYDSWGKNFYTTMLKLAAQGTVLKVVDDQWGSPTSCRALARQLQALVESGWNGTLHATCSGETTWHAFAAEIFLQQGLRVDLTPCFTVVSERPAPRPAYSVLSGNKRRSLGLDCMPEWRDALTEVVNELVGGQGMGANSD